MQCERVIGKPFPAEVENDKVENDEDDHMIIWRGEGGEPKANGHWSVGRRWSYGPRAPPGHTMT